MTQDKAFDIMVSGVNVFLTGIAGAGKTYLLARYMEYLRANRKPYGITASTGIAATALEGRTIHSFSGIGIRETLTPKDFEDISKYETVVRRIRVIHVLIIDEISMLSAEYLDLVDVVFKRFRDSNEPFGGVQVVFCGDFLQLPPVGVGRFSFLSTAWNEAKPVICYLDKPYRQRQGKLIEVLNAIRNGEVTEEVKAVIASRKNAPIKKKGIILFTHNVDVDGYNQAELNKLPGKSYFYNMRGEGDEIALKQLKKNCLSPELLELKVGVQAMVTRNFFDDDLVNGSMVEVVKCNPNSVEVRNENGKIVELSFTEWNMRLEQGIVIATVTQIPLRLAYAITVHKSQGMTLDYVTTNLSKVFQSGQGYVTLSRLRELENLSIEGDIPDQVFLVNEECLEYENKIKKESSNIEQTYKASLFD